MANLNRIKKYMGTRIEININSQKHSIDDLEIIAKEIFKKFEFVVKKFSRFDENSELSKLNRHHSQYFQVSKELFTLIDLSKKVAKQTNYIFDPTIIDLLKAFGYDKNYNEAKISNKLSQKNLIAQIESIKKRRKSIKDIKLDYKNYAIYLPEKVSIDLGASAKGFAIDLAVQVLRKHKISDFLINAGGDIFTGGEKKIALFNPKKAKNYKLIKITNKAIAGSGDFAKRVGIFSHLINPKKETKDFSQVYVIADTATIADIYSTALFLMGKKGKKLINDLGLKCICY